MAEKKEVLRTVDDEARKQAKGLMRLARHGALAVIDPETGVPMASRVAVACEASGAPLILISQLSGHFGALVANPKCSVLLGEPGKGDVLAHPRITVMAEAERLDGTERSNARERFLRYHPKSELYADFPDFAFWRLNPTGASLNGGFGKAYAMTPEDIASPVPEGFGNMEPGATYHMNDDHADAVELYAGEKGAWTLLGMDTEGMDLGLQERHKRVWFEPPLQRTDELKMRLVTLVKALRAQNS